MSIQTPATQVRHPWRTTLRGIFQGIVAFAVLLPFLVEASGLEPEVYPWLAGTLAVAAAITRIMALPQVEAFLERFIPWLAAEPQRRNRPEAGHADLATALLIIAVALLLFLAYLVAKGV